MGRPPRRDDHGGEVYVYRRNGEPCHVCGTRGAHRGAAGTQPLLVSAVPAQIPVPSTTVSATSRPSTRTDDHDRTHRRGPRAPDSGHVCTRRASAGRRRGAYADTELLAWLVVLTGALTVVVADLARRPCRSPSLMVPLLLGSLLLGPRQLPWFVVFVMVLLMLTIVAPGRDHRRGPSLAIAHPAPDLLHRAGHVVPPLPARRRRGAWASRCSSTCATGSSARAASRTCRDGWHAETALRSAGGTPFAGDFVVATGSRDADRLEIVVVDVSGKGEQAGTRALLLSGAFGGLLGALPPDQFLPGRQRLPAPPGLGGGLRHRGPPLARPRRPAPSRSARPATRRPRSVEAGIGPLDRATRRGAGARPDRGRRVHRGRRACCAPATRCCSTPTAWSRRRGATSTSASTGCSGEAEQPAARRASRAAPTGWSTRSARANDDRALVLVHRR